MNLRKQISAIALIAAVVSGCAAHGGSPASAGGAKCFEAQEASRNHNHFLRARRIRPAAVNEGDASCLP